MTSFIQPDRFQYEQDKILGEGLNSIVWRARRFNLSGDLTQTVALKLPKDQTSVPFLRREFETLTRVNSVYCVRVIAWESFSGCPALVLEWINGVTLFDLATAFPPLTNYECSELVRQIHCALLDLRSAGVCHGDLHPGNVMVDIAGRIRLIDFATGRSPDGKIQAARAFASPALLAGEEVSHESDLFALQVLRNHLPTGFRDLSEPKNKFVHLKPMKPAPENLRAQIELSKRVDRRLKPTSVGTEVLDPFIKKSVSEIRFKRSLTALSFVMAVALPVFGEGPAEQASGSAKIKVASQIWMQISLNGRDAGFAPLTISKLKDGFHRIKWTSAAGHGELRIELKPAGVAILKENGGRLEVH